MKADVKGQQPACNSTAPLVLRCNRVYEDTVQVQGEINGRKWLIMIDTASSHCLIRPDVLEQSHFHRQAGSIDGVTKNKGTVHGPVEVSMKAI